MSFQFGTNWPDFMGRVGNIAGPLLDYEVLGLNEFQGHATDGAGALGIPGQGDPSELRVIAAL